MKKTDKENLEIAKFKAADWSVDDENLTGEAVVFWNKFSKEYQVATDSGFEIIARFENGSEVNI